MSSSAVVRKSKPKLSGRSSGSDVPKSPFRGDSWRFWCAAEAIGSNFLFCSQIRNPMEFSFPHDLKVNMNPACAQLTEIGDQNS